MPPLQGPVPDFAGLYANPSIERMLSELSDHEFEHFVGYVFEQGGYGVEDVASQFGQGLDLKLFTGPTAARTLYGGVSVKHFALGNPFNGPHMMHFRGALGGHLQGYAITTSKFNAPALAEANKELKIWPIDGEHLLRYITYVRETRAADAEETEPDVRLRANPLAPIPPEVFLAADEITRRPRQRTTVLTLANHKGGVGKTTTALNLTFGLAAHNLQVLVVDMDPQANLTRMLPSQAPSAVPLHLGDYFTHRQPLSALVRQTQFKRVWLIPSDNALTRSDAGIAAGPGAELRFARDLHAEAVKPPAVLDAREFDWIIIDTGPSMGFFTRAALAASHFVAMPLAPGVFADMGLDLLLQTVEAMTALTNAPIKVIGGLVTQWRSDALNQQLLAAAKLKLGADVPLFKARIPLDKSHIEKAHIETGKGKRRTLFDTRSAAATAYTEAVDEVLPYGPQPK